MTIFLFRKPAVLGAALVSAMTMFALPALAQEGALMRHILGQIGMLPGDRDPIDYNERPGLVVPKDMSKLRAPEAPNAHAKNGNWPVDPDVVERENERKSRSGPFGTTRNDPLEGGRLSLKELSAGRSVRGATMGESRVLANDKGTIRMSPQEMEAAGKVASTPSYPPGTEPPRVYLTDPPKGLRLPSANAPVGKRTSDGPIVDAFDKLGAWKKDPE